MGIESRVFQDLTYSKCNLDSYHNVILNLSGEFWNVKYLEHVKNPKLLMLYTHYYFVIKYSLAFMIIIHEYDFNIWRNCTVFLYNFNQFRTESKGGGLN